MVGRGEGIGGEDEEMRGEVGLSEREREEEGVGRFEGK